MHSVLYVDDRDEELQSLRLELANSYRVHTCRTGAEAKDVVRRLRPSAVILDIDMPGYDGFRVLSDIRSLNRPPPVMMLSGHVDPLWVVRAMKEGASDFIAKPFFPSIVNRRLSMLIGNPVPAGSAPADRPGPANQGFLVGSSVEMQDLRDELLRYAASDLPVLILGESGTGKDLAARFIHYASSRAAGPFEVRNIASIPDTLMQSELFGCEDGAFTGVARRTGCFELANGGSLFLDEIGDASPSCQSSLLRVVEDGMVLRLGSALSRHVDCRLITATRWDLDRLVAERSFRDDLRWRLDVLTVHMPPLRAHREDIPELIDGLLPRLDPDLSVSDEAVELLMAYEWPGNVRELRTTLERASVLAERGTIEARQLERILHL